MSEALPNIFFAINNEFIEVPPEFANASLAEFLRNHKQLKGTKVVCEEGDCGACTVLVRKPNPSSENTWPYVAVNSCIAFMFQLHACHVLTIDALNSKEKMHPVQKNLFLSGAAQCGFCTPGFTMHMINLCESINPSQPTKHSGAELLEKSKQDLCGNLCRCTGYASIYEALEKVLGNDLTYENTSAFPDLPLGTQSNDVAFCVKQYENIYQRLNEYSRQSVTVKNGLNEIHIPATLNEALTILNSSSALQIVSGATDLGVGWNKSVGPNKNTLILPKDESLKELKRTFLSRKSIMPCYPKRRKLR